MLLGCIADDITGATDLALMLTRTGLRTVQVMEVPDAGSGLAAFDAVVVALKTRTIPAAAAVAASLAAADALLGFGARQIYFKYCSTFDSTDTGNIGPVADALLERLGSDLALVCPAFPTNKRTVYMGNLFVGEVALAESSMKDHPLTPMRDSNLVRVLQRQSGSKVGLVPYPVVAAGAAAIASAFAQARAKGERLVVVDAISDGDLVAMGKAAAVHRLITGGSGVALGLADNFVAEGLLQRSPPSTAMQARAGRRAILAGSCSLATRGQIRAAEQAAIPTIRVDARALADGRDDAAAIAERMLAAPSDRPVLAYSSAEPEEIAAVQASLGRDRSGALVEGTMAAIATKLVAAGVTQMIVAGGETSGAVVNGLGITALEIGPEIDPGVPWTRTLSAEPLALALKSGNFGAEDFFVKAWDKLTRA